MLGFFQISESMKKIAYKGYVVLRNWFEPHVDENIVPQDGSNNRVELNVNFNADHKSFNASLRTPDFATEMNNIELDPLVQSAVVLHPYYSISECVAQVWLNGQQFGKCTYYCIRLHHISHIICNFYE